MTTIKTINSEEKMEKSQTLNRSLDTLGWGAFFIWWGITEMFKSMPAGLGAIGIGVILLGLNLIRYTRGIPTSGFTTILGILAMVWGGLELAASLLSLPFELPIFAILLIALGLLILGGEILRTNHQA
jgi:hypothetical protein